MKIGILFALQSFVFVTVRSQIQILHEWRTVNYSWSGPEEKEYAIKEGLYDPNVVAVPNDVDAAAGKFFVTVQRDKGVPGSLFTITEENQLQMYPNFKAHTPDNCKEMTNVHSIATDKYGRLFALDTGKIGNLTICLPKILVFNVTNDSIIDRILVPPQVATNKLGIGSLTNLIVNVSPKDPHSYHIYMADSEGYGLVVFDGVRRVFRRLESDFFNCEPDSTRYLLGGREFEICEGIRSMALSTHEDPNERLLYFRSVASYYMNYVRAGDLHGKKGSDEIKYHRYDHKLQDRSSAMTMARYKDTDILFFNGIDEAAIRCWNSTLEFSESNVKTSTQDYLHQVISGMKVVSIMSGFEHLIVLAKPHQSLSYGTLNPEEVNFRVSATMVQGMIRNLLRQ